jgi:zinc protease
VSTAPSLIPAVGPQRTLKIPPHEDRRLRNGLRVLAVRRPTVPRFELRLRVPSGPLYDGGDGARSRLVPETILAGTEERSSVDIARELQRLGASLEAHADSDDMIIYGGGLAENLQPVLELLNEILREATYPAEEVAVARDRVAQEIIIRRSQPQGVAAEALAARVYGKHRYGRGLPAPNAMRRVGRGPLRKFHHERIAPRGSTLVLVGDIRPAAAIELAQQALRGWKGRPAGATPAPPPPPHEGRPVLLVNRPGSVQTTIRMAAPWPRRGEPDSYAAALANMVFGGYFSSRLTKNIREDKGYTYSPGSSADHRRETSTLIVAADVGTDVTAPALVEIRYELGRIAATTVGQDELDSARRFLAGVTALSIQTQSGLAGYLDSITAAGLDLEYVRSFRANLERVTIADVRDAAMRYLTPRRMTTVLVGDAAEISGPLEALDPLEITPAQ